MPPQLEISANYIFSACGLLVKMMCRSGPDVLSKIYVPKNILPDSFPPTSAHVEFFSPHPPFAEFANARALPAREDQAQKQSGALNAHRATYGAESVIQVLLNHWNTLCLKGFQIVLRVFHGFWDLYNVLCIFLRFPRVVDIFYVHKFQPLSEVFHGCSEEIFGTAPYLEISGNLSTYKLTYNYLS